MCVWLHVCVCVCVCVCVAACVGYCVKVLFLWLLTRKRENAGIGREDGARAYMAGVVPTVVRAMVVNMLQVLT